MKKIVIVSLVKEKMMNKDERDLAKQILKQIEIMQEDNIVILKEQKKLNYRVETVGALLAIVAIIMIFEWWV